MEVDGIGEARRCAQPQLAPSGAGVGSDRELESHAFAELGVGLAFGVVEAADETLVAAGGRVLDAHVHGHDLEVLAGLHGKQAGLLPHVAQHGPHVAHLAAGNRIAMPQQTSLDTFAGDVDVRYAFQVLPPDSDLDVRTAAPAGRVDVADVRELGVGRGDKCQKRDGACERLADRSPRGRPGFSEAVAPEMARPCRHTGAMARHVGKARAMSGPVEFDSRHHTSSFNLPPMV